MQHLYYKPRVVRYSRSRNRARVDVGLIVGISVTESVPSYKVRVVGQSRLVGCQVSRKLVALVSVVAL